MDITLPGVLKWNNTSQWDYYTTGPVELVARLEAVMICCNCGHPRFASVSKDGRRMKHVNIYLPSTRPGKRQSTRDVIVSNCVSMQESMRENIHSGHRRALICTCLVCNYICIKTSCYDRQHQHVLVNICQCCDAHELDDIRLFWVKLAFWEQIRTYDKCCVRCYLWCSMNRVKWCVVILCICKPSGIVLVWCVCRDVLIWSIFQEHWVLNLLEWPADYQHHGKVESDLLYHNVQDVVIAELCRQLS